MVLATALGLFAALGGFSSDPTPRVAAWPASPPDFAPLESGYVTIASGSSTHGPWRLAVGNEKDLICARLDYARPTAVRPFVKGCVNPTQGPLVFSAASGLVGVAGIAPPDVVTVKALGAGGRAIETPTIDGGPRFGVRFFVFPGVGRSDRPLQFVGYDAAGHEVGRLEGPR